MVRPFNLTILRSWVRERDAAGDELVAWPAAADAALGVFGKFKRYVRWQDWALSRIPMLCTVGAYLALARGHASRESLIDFFLFTFVFAGSHSAFGFLVNDLGDRDLDRRHGKANTFLELGAKQGLALLAAIAVVMSLSGFYFLDRPGFAPLWALWFLVAVAYSLPPLRLKERGAAGIIVSSLAQWTLPVLIAFAAFEASAGWELWLFVFATTASGAALELAHQRHDLPNDAATGTSTFAVGRGRLAMDRLYNSALWLDRSAVGVVLAVVVLRPPAIDLKAIPSLAIAATLVLIYFTVLWRACLRPAATPIDPYYGQRTLAHRILHDTLPNLLIPAFLLLHLAIDSPIWWAACLFFLIWRLALPRVN
jgi:4-hydroxybenzoate polyprenyltransferase